jgi:hypothetical protein
VSCSIYPALPDRFFFSEPGEVSFQENAETVSLNNPYLTVEISRTTGLVVGLVNSVVDSAYQVSGDETGFRIVRPGDLSCERWATSLTGDTPEIEVISTAESVAVVISSRFDGVEWGLEYTLRGNQFWVERSLFIKAEAGLGVLDEVVYGRVNVPGYGSHVLELGRFDRPRLVEIGSEGGLFSGVGWWFYQVDEEGRYQNQNMNYQCDREFKSEPFYLGVFASEEDEPYSGWLWYKTFLQQRKMEYDRQSYWSYWNAGWGQWGIDIDDPSVPTYLELIDRLGVKGVAFGSGVSGKGLQNYVSLVRSDERSKSNLNLLQRYKMAGGFLDQGGLKERWAERKTINAKLELLDQYANLGFKALYLDFFETVDTYTAHRNVGEYLGTAQRLLDYTECHLGMADYGPQFQRQVLLNHPTDLHGFAISHFSSDWATFLGFRHSRREWQERYDYLMPEYSLYYFVTHYSNWGHPRRYTDPEPQQLLYGPHAYCGIAYNFHDLMGFRNTLVAASAFTPYYVFGHLELKMPERDIEFASSYLRWVSENADLLSWARVCLETEDVCVVSKIKDGKGAIFLLNYGPEERFFRLRVFTGSDATTVREVYPLRKSPFEVNGANEFEVQLAGEQVVILEVNQGLRSLPPEDKGNFRKIIDDWVVDSSGLTGTISLPNLRLVGNRVPDLNLPLWLECLDQTGDVAEGILTGEQVRDLEMIELLGRGPLPKAFRQLYGFREGRLVETWKLVPWAFPNRIWFVLTPEEPVAIAGTFPELEVNGKKIKLFPRVDYREDNLELWNCPVLLADITLACNHGAENEVSLKGVDGNPICYVISSVLRV